MVQSQEEAAGLALQITDLTRQLHDGGEALSAARSENARGVSMRGELELLLQDTRGAQAQVGIGLSGRGMGNTGGTCACHSVQDKPA